MRSDQLPKLLKLWNLLLSNGVCRGWVLYSPYESSFEAGGYLLGGAGNPWHSVNGSVGSFDLDGAVVRWSQPLDVSSRDGLGGAITWAMGPNFCPKILSGFRSEKFLFGTVQFLDCNALRAAIAHSFDTWGANHRDIDFYDATDECASSDENAADDCAEVRLMITDFSANGNDLAAMVSMDLLNAERSPRSTAGRVIPGGFGIRKACIMFSEAQCWYLDETFCAAFHAELGNGDSIHGWIRVVLLFLFTFSTIYLLRVALELAAVHSNVKGDAELREILLVVVCRRKPSSANSLERTTNGSRCGAVLSYASKVNLCWMLLAMLGVTFPPVFYVDVFLPCIECQSFRATVAHEVGHMLGFHHPDTLSGLNLRSTQRPALPLNESSCDRPLSKVRLASPPEATRQSIMYSMTQHRVSTCLTDDDMEGLHYLYPTCSDPQISRRASCTSPTRVTGYLRLATALSVPYGSASCSVLLLLMIIRSSQRMRLTRIRKQRGVAMMQARWLRSSLMALNVRRAKGLLPNRPNRHNRIGAKAQAAMERRTECRRAGEAVAGIWGARRLSAEPLGPSQTSSTLPLRERGKARLSRRVVPRGNGAAFKKRKESSGSPTGLHGGLPAGLAARRGHLRPRTPSLLLPDGQQACESRPCPPRPNEAHRVHHSTAVNAVDAVDAKVTVGACSTHAAPAHFPAYSPAHSPAHLHDETDGGGGSPATSSTLAQSSPSSASMDSVKRFSRKLRQPILPRGARNGGACPRMQDPPPIMKPGGRAAFLSARRTKLDAFSDGTEKDLGAGREAPPRLRIRTGVKNGLAPASATTPALAAIAPIKPAPMPTPLVKSPRLSTNETTPSPSPATSTHISAPTVPLPSESTLSRDPAAFATPDTSAITPSRMSSAGEMLMNAFEVVRKSVFEPAVEPADEPISATQDAMR